MSTVTLENVCKSFGEVKAVDDLSFEVPKATIFGFLGPNGAGKTTTIRMIMNIIRPDSGRIGILGSSAERAKDSIGYMPEERGLYRKMKVRNCLTYFASLKNVAAKQLSTQANKWLEKVGLADWADKKVEDLSRGMHQKLQFAVTVVNEPELLILDEPFSGLDPLNQELLKDVILEMRSRGATVIFSTHMMHEAEQLCDSILLINRGRTVVEGKLSEIRARHRTGVVSVELEGNTNFINQLPMVAKVVQNKDKLEIYLGDDSDTQELLKAIVEQVRVQNFEVKVPSLHEIFVSLVRDSDAKNS